MKSIYFKVCAVIAVLVFANFFVSAQSRSTSKPSDEKKTTLKTKSSKSAEMEREKRQRNTTFNRTKNKIAQKGKTVVLPMQYHGVSEPLSELVKRQQPPISKENGKIQESDHEPILEDTSEAKTINGLPAFLQTELLAPSAAILGTNFEGPGIGLPGFSLTGAPPDTTMAVGPNHIVAWVNSMYAVFNKTGTVLLGPVNGNTLFTGVGGNCETTNRGDPILQYDRLADRWFLSQFAFSAGTTAPYFQCIAVSTTNNPTGTYARYSIAFSAVAPSGLNDYGKLGVWNDAYYTAYNMFQGSPAGANSGVALCASDRTKMLAADPTATTLCAPIAFYGGGASFLPADLDGAELPTDLTRGGVFMRYSTGGISLRILRLKPNFTSSTVTLTDGYGGAAGTFVNFPTGALTLPCNGTGGTCVAQPGTANTLDTLGSRLMYRLAYRNRGGVDSLLVNIGTDPDGAGARSSAIRWFEIRNPLANPADTVTGKRPFLYQNATYDPGATSDRWMGSVAMNKYGDVMLGYSIANAGTGLKPSIALAGRSQCDTLNTLQAEAIAHTGTGSQTGTLTRWGDYSTMQVDPSDDETFWFTTQYLATDGTFNWRTRVVSAKFPTTTATSNGDFSSAGSWSNGVPNATTTGIIPSGRTLTVNSNSTVCSLNVDAGATLVMNANLTVTGALTLGTQVNTGANTLGLGCNGTVSGASTSNYVIGNFQKDFCANQAFSYPTGTANGYSPVNANVTATTNPSSLLVAANQGNKTGMNAANSLQRYWTLTNTAGTLTTDMVFNYNDPLDVVGTESSYKLFRFTGATGTDQTPITLDTAANTLSKTGISSFSDWAVGNLAPTAADASVSGRVLTSTGRGISRATITLTDLAGNTRYALTNSFGNYRFDNVESGQNHVLTVKSKRFRFPNPSQTIFVGEDLTGIDFVALP
jgi:Carboxypeptidase regulatory-like domain